MREENEERKRISKRRNSQKGKRRGRQGRGEQKEENFAPFSHSPQGQVKFH